MAVVGVGTDVVDVLRVSRLVAQRGRPFVDRWFRPSEVGPSIASAEGSRRVAALLAVKEAAFKSLAAPHHGPVPWRDIEVLTSPDCPPQLRLHGAIRDLAASAGVSTFHVAMATTEQHATATVVAVAGEGQESD